MASTFSWLAYDEGEAEELRRLVEAFGDKGTLDPIGFGSIRDGVADQLFPGISTIQTRARYFVLVPRIFQALEAERVPPDEFPERRRQAEIELIDALLRGQQQAGASSSDPEWLGIIGRNVRDGIRTTPAVIYWNGMWTFRIRRFPGATAEHSRRLAAHYRGGSGPRLDEDGQPIDGGSHLWDPAVPRAGEFPDAVESFQLTGEESDYLTERMQQTCPDSVLAAMLLYPDALSDADAPWDIPPTSPQLEQLVTNARFFSVLIHGLQLLYNRLLLQRAAADLDAASDTERIDEVDEGLADWRANVAELGAGRLEALSRFDTLVQHIRGDGSRVPQATVEFFRAWIHDAADDPEQALSNPRHAEAVRVRERQLKGQLAKLTSRPALEAWATSGELQAVGRLNYRWSNAHRIVSDIVAARGEIS